MGFGPERQRGRGGVGLGVGQTWDEKHSSIERVVATTAARREHIGVEHGVGALCVAYKVDRAHRRVESPNDGAADDLRPRVTHQHLEEGVEGSPKVAKVLLSKRDAARREARCVEGMPPFQIAIPARAQAHECSTSAGLRVGSERVH